jgi:chromosome segregation ATPase
MRIVCIILSVLLVVAIGAGVYGAIRNRGLSRELNEYRALYESARSEVEQLSATLGGLSEEIQSAIDEQKSSTAGVRTEIERIRANLKSLEILLRRLDGWVNSINRIHSLERVEE